MANLIGVTPAARPVVELVRLEITGEEAEALRIVLGHVGGIPSSRRGLMDNISKVLNEVLGGSYKTKGCEGTVRFTS